ncbi:hypothetical protein [Actinoplanes sp. NPDC089786]|uniref:hypothetical protein n=1 Tax=Actinoplanes sp. NPDC089786 TaxID=3155185 RepID=UPI00342B39DF
MCVPLPGDLALGSAPDLLRTGLATLELLTTAARDQPLLGLVDDAQWLDAASTRTLTFVARRLSAEPIALLFAARTPPLSTAAPSSGPGVLAELPGLEVDGLADTDARAVLADRHRTLDEQVRDRIVAEARGNPLALLELPSAGGFGPPAPMTARIENSFRNRLARLPAGARLLLTVAGADPTGDPRLLWPAVHDLDVDVPAATAATIRRRWPPPARPSTGANCSWPAPPCPS